MEAKLIQEDDGTLVWYSNNEKEGWVPTPGKNIELSPDTFPAGTKVEIRIPYYADCAFWKLPAVRGRQDE